MKPKFTDTDRYRNGYTPSSKTNITKTFDRLHPGWRRPKKEQPLAVAVPIRKRRTA